MASNKAVPCVICAYPSVSRCSGCKQAAYCSRDHQKHAWPKHKKLCKIYQQSLPPPTDSYCGLCGATKNLTTTECCNRTICNDEDSYQTYSYSSVSCLRNHRRYTLCASHHTEGHGAEKNWKDCQKCMNAGNRKEDVVTRGTSSFNFREDEWKDAPTFDPAKCTGCGRQVKTACEAFSPSVGGGVSCMACITITKMDFGSVHAMDHRQV